MSNTNDNTSHKASVGERMKEAAHGHFTEALQGQTRATPERSDPGRELAEAEVARRTQTEDQGGRSSSRAGSNSEAAYGGALAGAGAATALNAGLGAGAGGAAVDYGAEPDLGRSAGGRNDREFAGCRGAEGPVGSAHPEGTGPAPDRTQTGPGTGVPSDGLQRLP